MLSAVLELGWYRCSPELEPPEARSKRFFDEALMFPATLPAAPAPAQMLHLAAFAAMFVDACVMCPSPWRPPLRAEKPPNCALASAAPSCLCSSRPPKK